MELYNVETRQKESLDDPKALHEAILSGTHSFKSGTRVNVFDPNGKEKTLPAEQVQSAIADGFKVLTPSQVAVNSYLRENKGLVGALKVGALQFADEAAFGVPELIFNKTQDPLEVAKKEALKEEHSLFNTLGGIAGFGASLFTGGPLWRAGTKAGEAVAANIAKKIAAETGEQVGKRSLTNAAKNITAKIGGATAEGAIVTAPHVITEAALGDPLAAGETLLAGAGVGAFFGGALGLGKEFLNLGNKVSKEVAEKSSEMLASKQKLARMLAQSVTGVDEATILYYLDNIERVNQTPDFLTIKNKVDDAYLNLANDVTMKKARLQEITKDLETSFKNLKNDMKSDRASREFAIDVVDKMNEQKAVLGEMRETADDLLLQASGGIEKDTLLNTLDEISESIIPSQYGDNAVNAAKSIKRLRDRISEAVEKNEFGSDDVVDLFSKGRLKGTVVEYPEVYQIIKQLDSDTSAAYNLKAGEFNETTDRIKMLFRRKLSDRIKKDVDGYAEQMEEMSKLANSLGKMSKLFPDEVTAANRLSAMAKKGQKPAKEISSVVDEVAPTETTVKIYHGSPAKFNADDIKSSDSGDWGKGIYAADDLQHAKEYGENIVELDIDPWNIFDLSLKDNKFSQLTLDMLEDLGFDAERLNVLDDVDDAMENLLSQMRDRIDDGFSASDDEVRAALSDLLSETSSGIKFTATNNKDAYLLFGKDAIRPSKKGISGMSKKLDYDQEVLEEFSNLTGSNFYSKSAGQIPGRKTIYHGSWNEFKSDAIKAGDGNYGQGVYLVDDATAANNYGDFIHKYDIEDGDILDLTANANNQFSDETMQVLDSIRGVYTKDINKTSKYRSPEHNLQEAIRDAYGDEAVGYDVWEKLKELVGPKGIKGFKFRQNDADNYVIFDPSTLKPTMDYPAAGGRLGELMKTKEVAAAIDRGEDLRSLLVPNLTKQKEEALKAFEEARDKLQRVGEFSPKRSESSMRNLGTKRPKIETNKAIEALSEFAGEDFADIIRNRNTLDAFSKASTQGSRKVNLGAFLGYGSVGGAMLTPFLGPMAMAGGAAAGAFMDNYGGLVLKHILDKNPAKSGLLFVEKNMRRVAKEIDEIPDIIDRMSQKKTKLKARTLAMYSLWRLTGEDVKTKISKEDQIEKINEKINGWLSDPTMFDAMINKFTNPLSEGGAPNIAEGLSLGAQKALQYLREKVPKPPKPSSPFVAKVNWTPSDVEVEEFAMALEVAENPFIVLRRLEEGMLTETHIDALKNIFPYVYGRIQEKIIDTAVNNPKPLNYADRLKLSILSGMPLDESMTDQSFLSLQKKFMNEQPEQENLEEPFSPTQQIDLAKSNSTTYQQVIS